MRSAVVKRGEEGKGREGNERKLTIQFHNGTMTEGKGKEEGEEQERGSNMEHERWKFNLESRSERTAKAQCLSKILLQELSDERSLDFLLD